MSTSHVLVDETKANGLIVVVARFPAAAGPDLAAAMLGLRVRGQTHLHYTKENPARRAQILRMVLSFAPVIDVYDARATRDERAGRRWALTQVVEHTALDGGQLRRPTETYAPAAVGRRRVGLVLGKGW